MAFYLFQQREQAVGFGCFFNEPSPVLDLITPLGVLYVSLPSVIFLPFLSFPTTVAVNILEDSLV